MREGVGRIEGQWRQGRENLACEVTTQPGLLVVAQFGHSQNGHAVVAQPGRQIVVPTLQGLLQMAEKRLADGRQLFQGSHAVRRGFQDAAGHLTAEAGDADHKEFVQVGGENGQKFDALQ